MITTTTAEAEKMAKKPMTTSNNEDTPFDESPKAVGDASVFGHGHKSHHDTNGHGTTNGSSSLVEDKPTSPPPKESHSTTSSSRSMIGTLLRSLLLDLPLVTLFTVYLALLVLRHSFEEYYIPQAELMRWTNERKTHEMTYYNRACGLQDMTALDTDPLIISPDMTPKDCMHHQAKHGVSIYPDILKGETADKLHSWVTEHNKLEEGFYVINNKHRFSFGIGVNQDPIVATALHEIAHHAIFRPAIQEISGPNPAVIEFTAITSEFGAKDQFWHQDTLPKGSAFKYARSFIPSYSLFIPLQDTTRARGATQICPGSHVCNGQDDMCRKAGFHASGSNDLWPKGAGALVNQHTHHRGMGHVDKHGPDRVLFILTFAPRPRFGFNEVETRLFSMGGSFSINWRNWGHTLNDFGNAPVAMAEPWKTMRALGLYKSASADWGWDWVTVASMRITNGDNGYSPSNLDEFLEEGGLKWLPSWLEGELEYEDEGWYDYIDKTIDNCELFVWRMCVIAVVVYLLFFWLVDVLRGLFGKPQKSSIKRAVTRLVVWNGCLFVLASCCVLHISRTQWARNIKNEKEYTLPAYSRPEGMAPGTFAEYNDVLVETKYDSEYLHMYNYILEDAHPGNRNFKSILVHNSKGYAGLTPSMKKQLCSAVIDWVGQNHGRFLTPNEEGNWSKMDDSQARRVIHKEFMKHDVPAIDQVLTKLSFLLSETKFGVFRDMAIHRSHIPDMLRKLQDKIVEASSTHDVVVTKLPVATKSSSRTQAITIGRTFSLPRVRLHPRNVVNTPLQRPHLPPRLAIQEPYEGAWWSEGDVVEAKYKGKKNVWMRATIVSIDGNKETYNVRYDDGFVGERLRFTFLRPWQPFKLGDKVKVRDDDDGKFYKGRVIRIQSDGTCDVESAKFVYEQVTPGRMRRYTESGKDADVEFQVGSQIEAMYQGEGDWYPGQIESVNADGTFDVLYDDGDSEYGVELELIRDLR